MGLFTAATPSPLPPVKEFYPILTQVLGIFGMSALGHILDCSVSKFSFRR